MTKDSEEIERLHWTELDGKCFRGSKKNMNPELCSDMVLGMVKLQKFSEHKGGVWCEVYYNVTYDRAYVVTYIRLNLLTPLAQVGWKGIMEIVSDAYSPMRSTGRQRAVKNKDKEAKEID